jgi:ABC-2 type transport system permease protein
LSTGSHVVADRSHQAPLGDPGEPILRPITGPSALGGGRRRSWELLTLLAVTDFKRAYFGTALGYVWSIARPLMLFGVLLAVFTQVFRIGSDVPNYAVLLLFNIVLFGFFSEATITAVQSLVNQEPVIRKTQFPRLVIPLAVVLTTLFNLGLNLIAVFVFIFAWGITPTWTWLLFPVLLLLLFIITTAVSMIVSALYPRFRDTFIIWSVAATVLFYATPVLYPLEVAPEGLREVLALSPLAPLFEAGRHWIIDPTSPGPVAATGGYGRLLIPIALYVGICLLAVWLFRREAPRVAEQL